MAKFKLPKSLSDQSAEILRVLALQSRPIKNIEINDLVDKKYSTYANKQLSSLKTRGYVDNKDGGAIITQHGLYILSNLSKVHIQKSKVGLSAGKKLARNKIEDAPLQLNISSAANNLSDHISTVLHENQQYRDLLLTLHKTIGNALQLDEEEVR